MFEVKNNQDYSVLTWRHGHVQDQKKRQRAGDMNCN